MLLALLSPAFAYETDQLTARSAPLPDIAILADAKVDELLARAIARTNQETRCSWRPATTRALLATHIYAETSHAEYVKNRGELAGLGYGAYAAWLETAPDLARRQFVDRDDIYGDLKPSEALVLGTVGVCSTVRIAGVLMGTDKPDHFWSQGYEYFLASRFGRNDARAILWGTDSERGQYGLLTSDVFSFADLYANWEGYQFYKGLLQKGGILQIGDDGCVVQAHPWHWREWLDDAADEVINPSVYGPHVRESVQARLSRERPEICADYASWGPEAAEERAQVISREAVHVAPGAPARKDEWELDELCAQ